MKYKCPKCQCSNPSEVKGGKCISDDRCSARIIATTEAHLLLITTRRLPCRA